MLKRTEFLRNRAEAPIGESVNEAQMTGMSFIRQLLGHIDAANELLSKLDVQSFMRTQFPAEQYPGVGDAVKRVKAALYTLSSKELSVLRELDQ